MKRDRDINDLLPYLFPDDIVLSVTYPELQVPKTLMDAGEALMQIARSPSLEEIGEHGPPVAAVATKENEDVPSLNLFEALFGRDSLIVSRFVLPQFPKLARATILALAKLQGVRVDNIAEEEPGRIMHEHREEGDAIGVELREERAWSFPYYGSVDATPLFIILLTEYIAQEGQAIFEETYLDRDGTVKTVRDAYDRAVAWIVERTERNPEGFLEFCRVNQSGIENQVWKDSYDSYCHDNGDLANHEKGIASVEVQGYAYDALLDAADLYELHKQSQVGTGRYTSEHISSLRKKAATLRENTLLYMWIEDERGGYFALGTDRGVGGELRTLKVRTSNMGHILSSRMLSNDDPKAVAMCQKIVATLTSDEMQNSGGIRTLSKKELRFTPGAYHNGSVWLWDTYICARGMRMRGFSEEADILESKILASVEATKKYPEFVRGSDTATPEISIRVVDIRRTRDNWDNRIEQPPQEVQAWTVASVLAIHHRRQSMGQKRGT